MGRSNHPELPRFEALREVDFGAPIIRERQEEAREVRREPEGEGEGQEVQRAEKEERTVRNLHKVRGSR